MDFVDWRQTYMRISGHASCMARMCCFVETRSFIRDLAVQFASQPLPRTVTERRAREFQKDALFSLISTVSFADSLISLCRVEVFRQFILKIVTRLVSRQLPVSGTTFKVWKFQSDVVHMALRSFCHCDTMAVLSGQCQAIQQVAANLLDDPLVSSQKDLESFRVKCRYIDNEAARIVSDGNMERLQDAVATRHMQ